MYKLIIVFKAQFDTFTVEYERIRLFSTDFLHVYREVITPTRGLLGQTSAPIISQLFYLSKISGLLCQRQFMLPRRFYIILFLPDVRSNVYLADMPGGMTKFKGIDPSCIIQHRDHYHVYLYAYTTLQFSLSAAHVFVVL